MGRRGQGGRRRPNVQPSRLGDLGGPSGPALEVVLKAGADFHECVRYLGEPLSCLGEFFDGLVRGATSL